MQIQYLLRSILEVAVVIPIGLFCLITFMPRLKVKAPFCIGIYTLSTLVFSVVFGTLRVNYKLNINYILLIVATFALGFVLLSINENKMKIIYIFISATSFTSSIMLFGYLLEAHQNQYNNYYDVEGWGLVIRIAMLIVFFAAFFFMLKKIRWLMDSSELGNVWAVVWLVPLVFIVGNVMMIPHNYILFTFGRIKAIYTTIATVQLVMNLVFQYMLYYIAKNIAAKNQSQQQAQMLSIQAAQYEGLQRHIQATSKLRHDFKHTARTAVALAQEGDNEGLIKLLTDYGIEIEKSHTQTIFTQNSTLNAIIGYYYARARELEIICNWRVSLPEKINIDVTDLCSVVGNLLENAIHATKLEDDIHNRYITFKADLEENGDIYIVTTNGFSGKTKKEHGRYLSTKKNGSGLGIASVKSTAERYGGIASFYNDEKTFYADVMLKQKSN
ncbi:MAG: sensor histidine kinase [Clostridia bacterium]|nr:sensor histidine kinase [Clostridia bacterium]